MEQNVINDLPNLNWFPGHMVKARRLITENLKLVDVVVELLDARIPLSSANPLLDEIIGKKPRLVVLNKADLANDNDTRKWIEYFKKQDIVAVSIDAISGKGLKQLVRLACDLSRPRTDRLVKKGVKPRAARLMIVGIPNVGKSSLINRLAGSVKAKAENRPGVTRAKQWIKIAQGLELLDMPGILWPKFEDPIVGLYLAFTGAINDEAYDMEAVSLKLLEKMRIKNKNGLVERFGIVDFPDNDRLLLEMIGKKRGCILKGGIVDKEKVERLLLSEYRMGKIGKITLDEIPMNMPLTEKSELNEFIKNDDKGDRETSL